MKPYKKPRNKRPLAGILNIIHGVLATIFLIGFQFGPLGEMLKLTSDTDGEVANQNVVTFFMMFQLTIVISGIAVVVASINERGRVNIYLDILALAIAGLDVLLLLASGAVSVFAFVNIVIGALMMLYDFGKLKRLKKKDEDVEF